MDFRPLMESERKRLITALRGNGEGTCGLLMDRKDTSFAGSTTTEDADADDLGVVCSVPVHY